jgi:hypothetical protein
MNTSRKKVVYLFGTGATQAEARLVDDRIRLGMSDIKDGILRKIDKKKIKKLDDIKNELANPNADVEQLITVYESSGCSEHKTIAKSLRVLFREEILEQIKILDSSARATNGRFTPRLYSALIDMYEIKGIKEKLTGIMTLNYEDIVERAAQRVKGGVNYALDIIRCNNSYLKVNKRGILILKMHGSFNWQNQFPPCIKDNLKKEEDVLWIPPGVEKHTDSYPYNIIWGKARELLDCDILRIIGCSLSKNEWHLVSMLYATQKLNKQKKEYTIEIISSPKTGKAIREAYPHLKIRAIYEINEIKDFVYKSLYALSKPNGRNIIDDNTITEYLNNKNSFELWLRAKGDDLTNNGFLLKTPNNIFRDFMRGA